MNLNDNPTIEQLREIIGSADDSAGDHILWVRKNGEVELSPLPKGQTLVEFEEAHPDLQIRCETFLAGNEYVGPEAASDDEWLSELFDSLTGKWPSGSGNPEVAWSWRT